MERAQLKSLLASQTSIVFDARAHDVPSSDGGQVDKLPPLFEHSLLKNVILIKSMGRADPSNSDGDGLQTRLYIPFDNTKVASGGKSIICGGNCSIGSLERFFGVEKIDPERIEGDLKKIAVFARAPSLSPFLLRDAFERAGLHIDKRYFRISDVEVDALRNTLKAKLKPLAAMALGLSPTLAGNAQLDLLSRKLWELDDRNFLLPFGAALKIPEPDTIDVFYALIGVAYFQHEFAKRLEKLKQLAKWLAAKAPFADGANEDAVRAYDEDRSQVRACLRMAWSSAGSIFELYTSLYDALIADDRDPLPFVNYLKRVQVDFADLGANLTVIEQCLCFYDAVAAHDRAGMQSVNLLRGVARSLRGVGGSDSNQAAA